ncbi:restriction endonuclease subunit S [Limnoraphis robusta Tam1]|uniref:restriction endonuclease subunit S n=1 Tax=Limnoraphis robusta TaxID=1118279 RepID=UPI002B2218D1|nr:restriction endonuclease subunit S [Limnoraphis robusta]MEA5497936.1 restriction endonuclease subunit S [Limnoraphis robusta BA-68 BA1]MEA5542958.1 restriction endonuclease subunit S [Limnoraphis robusta Tam1]
MKLEEHKKKLPDGWRWVKLSEICKGKGQYGTSKKASDNPNAIPVLRMGNISNGRIDWSDLKYILMPQAEEEKYRLIKGDILFNRTNSAELVGKTAVFDGLQKAVFASYLIRFRVAEDRAEPFYLSAYINSAFGRSFIEANMTRAIGQVNINASIMEAMPIPLPPLDEQKRIAAILNEKMEAVERSRQATLAQLEAAKTLPSAYLRAVFNNPEAQKWERKRLGDMCQIVAPQVDPKIKEYGVLPHVNGENIAGGVCRLLYLNTAAEDGMTSGKYLFDSGDVLYSKLRPYLRKAVFVDFQGLCSADMYPIKVNPNFLDPQFTTWMLVSDEFTKYADEESRRARMPKLNREELFAYNSPLPCLSEQKRIAADLNEKTAEVQKLHKALEEQLEAINKMPSAFLRQAFNGEL